MEVSIDSKKSRKGRGPNKRLTKGRAYSIAADILIRHLSSASYKVAEGTNNPVDTYDLSDEEAELIYAALDDLAKKMAKSIGRGYYSI